MTTNEERYRRKLEQKRAASERWRSVNPERAKTLMKQWRDANREAIRMHGRRNYIKHKAKISAASKLYRQKNRRRIADRKAIWRAAKLIETKRAIFERLGGPRCKSCGYDADIRALQIDHIHGDGAVHRKGISSQTRYYADVLRDGPTRFQILCANCNHIKRIEKLEHGGWRRMVA